MRCSITSFEVPYFVISEAFVFIFAGCFFFILPLWLSLDIIRSLPITLIVYLLLNFALANIRIYYLLLIILLLHFNIFVIIDSKLLYKKSRLAAIAILSHMSWFNIIAPCNCFISNKTFAKILIISF